jgi:uncharacterized protein YndB with AHSA1/START domain
VLEQAGLVASKKVGRQRFVYLDPVPIVQLAQRWLDDYSARAGLTLVHLKRHLEAETSMPDDSTGANPSSKAGTRTIHAAILVEASPSQVWSALTEPGKSRQWYFGTAIRSSFDNGAPLEYVDDAGVVQIRGVIVEAVPCERLVHTFNATWSAEVAGDPESLYEWRLEAVGTALTRVSITHSGVPVATVTEGEVEQGATLLLSALKTLLETGRPLRVGV